MLHPVFFDDSVDGQAYFVLTQSFDPRSGGILVHKRPAARGDADAAADLLKHEFAVLQHLQGVKGVPQVLRLDIGKTELVTHAIDGLRLDNCGWVGKLQTTHLLNFAVAASLVLQTVHDRGVLHLGLCPRRILILEEGPGEPDLAIVGFAGSTLPGVDPDFLSRQAPTTLSAYAAPELTGRMNRSLGPRTDLYALGVILYELACGRLPFDHVNPLSLVHAHLARVPTLAHQVRPGIPPGLSAILARMLHKEPEKRFASASELIRELKALRSSLEVPGIDAMFANSRSQPSWPLTEEGVSREVSTRGEAASERLILRVAASFLQSLDTSGHIGTAQTGAVAALRSATERSDLPTMQALMAHLGLIEAMKTGPSVRSPTIPAWPALASPAVVAVDDVHKLLTAIMRREARTLIEHVPKPATMAVLQSEPYLAAMYQFANCMALSVRIEMSGAMPSGTRSSLIRRLADDIQGLQNRTATQPGNLSHLSTLMMARQASLEERLFEAARHHDDAMTLASRSSHAWHEALIVEHAGLFQLKHRFETGSRRLLQRSAVFYHRWGADEKLRLLHEEFPFLALMKPSNEDHPLTSSSASTSAAVDRYALLQASQALASETDLTRLVTRMVAVIKQLAGATAAAVFFNDDQEGWLLAGARRGDHAVTGLPTPASSASLHGFAASIVRHALADPRAELIGSATQDTRFADDPQLSEVDCCSILLMPIRSKGTARAVLLLENNLSSGFFTGRDLETLELITVTLATSIENALLYRSLARRVAERTHDLERVTLAEKHKTERLAAVFELSPDGFVVADWDGVVSIVNPAFEAMTGLPASALIGLCMDNFEDMLAERTESRDTTDDGKSELLRLRKPQAYTLKRGKRKDESAGLETVMYFRDVTREMEIDRMKSDFLSTAAHELRTPVSIISGFTELVLKREMSIEQRESMLKTIHRQSGSLLSMMNDLLDLARIEARRGTDFQYRVQLLRPIVVDTLATVPIIGANRQVRLHEPDEPAWVNVDAKKMSNAITNILSNAIKYSFQGDIDIDFVSRTHRDREEVGVSVTDRGIGMSPVHLHRLFERFFRVDSSGRIPGTGLGTTIAKEIVDVHGGELVAESQLGVGTRMTIWLPRQESPPADSMQA